MIFFFAPPLLLFILVHYLILRYILKRLARRTPLRHRDSTLERKLKPLWKTRRWWILSGVFSLWHRGKLPFGPYRAFCGPHYLRDATGYSSPHMPSLATILASPGKPTEQTSQELSAQTAHLRALLRMGIFPLCLKHGGTSTWWATWLRRWVQSKQRAIFVFAVPGAKGFSLSPSAPSNALLSKRTEAARAFVREILALSDAWGWHVCVSGELPAGRVVTSTVPPPSTTPLEIGVKARFKRWLKSRDVEVIHRAAGLQEDSVECFLQEGYVPHLEKLRYPVVRIEMPGYGRCKLDRVVYRVAQASGLEGLWDEGIYRGSVEEWFEKWGWEYPGEE